MERKDRSAQQSRRRRTSSFESRSPLRAVTDGEFKRREPPDLSAFRSTDRQPQDDSTQNSIGTSESKAPLGQQENINIPSQNSTDKVNDSASIRNKQAIEALPSNAEIIDNGSFTSFATVATVVSDSNNLFLVAENGQELASSGNGGYMLFGPFSEPYYLYRNGTIIKTFPENEEIFFSFQAGDQLTVLFTQPPTVKILEALIAEHGYPLGGIPEVRAWFESQPEYIIEVDEYVDGWYRRLMANRSATTALDRELYNYLVDIVINNAHYARTVEQSAQVVDSVAEFVPLEAPTAQDNLPPVVPVLQELVAQYGYPLEDNPEILVWYEDQSGKNAEYIEYVEGVTDSLYRGMRDGQDAETDAEIELFNYLQNIVIADLYNTFLLETVAEQSNDSNAFSPSPTPTAQLSLDAYTESLQPPAATPAQPSPSIALGDLRTDSEVAERRTGGEQAIPTQAGNTQTNNAQTSSVSTALQESQSGTEYVQQLAETISSYRGALLNEIPTITERFVSARDNNIFQTDTVTAWDKMSQLFVEIYPQATNGETISVQAIDVAVQAFFDLLYRDVSRSASGGPMMPFSIAPTADQLSFFAKEQDWVTFYRTYYQFSIGVSRWLLEHPDYRAQDAERDQKINQDWENTDRLQKTKNTEEQLTEAEAGYSRQLSEFRQNTRGFNPVPVTAYFVPAVKDGAEQPQPVPLTMYYWEEDGEWNLSQIHATGTFNNDRRKSSDSERVPPAELFQELNSKKRFPVGMLHYAIPGEPTATVEIDGRATLADWFSWIGLGSSLLGLGLTIASGGTLGPVLTSAYVALGVGSVASGTAAAIDLAEELEHGDPNALQVGINVLAIAASGFEVGALSASAVKLGIVRPGGQLSSLQRFADGAFLPLTGATVGTDLTSFALLSADTVQQIGKIQSGGGSDADKERAIRVLLAQLAVTGGLVTLSVQGSAADIQAGSPLRISDDVDSQGRPALTIGEPDVQTANTPQTQGTNPNVSQMQPEQIRRLENIIRLEESGNIAGAEQAYRHLQDELEFSDAEFSDAKSTVSRLIRDGLRPTTRSYILDEELARRRGIVTRATSEDLVVAAENNLRRLFEESKMFVAIPEDNLESLLREGRYKTIFESPELLNADYTNLSSADMARLDFLRETKEKRAAAELYMFGYSADLPAEYRPVSGYIASSVDAPESPGALAYSTGVFGQGGGGIVIRLSDEVRSRTTFTGDDSLANGAGGIFSPADTVPFRQPSGVDNPNITSFLSFENVNDQDSLSGILERVAEARSLEDLHSLKKEIFPYSAYIEIQVHGQVSTSDIAEIVYVGGLRPSSAVEQLAREESIPIGLE